MATPGITGGRGARSTRPGQFDAFRLASRGEAFAGEVDVARRPRVVDLLAQTAAPAIVSWRVEGGHDAFARPMLTLTIGGRLPLVCQRCLQAFEAPIERRAELLLARDENELARLDAEEAEALLASMPLDALTLVEDELLLSLPFAPMHPEAQCPATPAQSVGPGDLGPKQDMPSPFARLAVLKKGAGGTFEE